MNVWCRMVGHTWSWRLARSWGYTHAPMCRRCQHVPPDLA